MSGDSAHHHRVQPSSEGRVAGAGSATQVVPTSPITPALVPNGLGDRQTVLWMGASIPRLLTAACLQHGLEVVSVQRADLEAVFPKGRALVLEVPVDDAAFESWGSQVSSKALEHGLVVALVQYEEEGAAPFMEDQEAVLKFYAAVKRLHRDPSRVIAMYRDWGRIAKWAHDHDPGPGANRSVVIDGSPREEGVNLLLQRAFHDFGSISLELLSGGKSGASVWRIHPGDADRARRAIPFVVKIHNREKMRSERSNSQIVRNGVEQRLYAQLYSERCVDGDDLGLVVYDVVARAMPFRAMLPASPEALVRSLFEQTLHGFRSRATLETRRISEEFGPGRLKALRWSDGLRTAAAFARTALRSLPDVDALEHMFGRLPPMRVTLATVHGDLHAGNLFVPVGSTDVLMIDYGSVLQSAPAIADPACLEVSLTFPPTDISSGGETRLLTQEWRRQAYRYPFELPTDRGLPIADAWISQALGAIRARAIAVEPSSEAYGVAVASYLIRFASFDDHSNIEERALAYELAFGILERILDDAQSQSEAKQLRIVERS